MQRSTPVQTTPIDIDGMHFEVRLSHAALLRMKDRFGPGFLEDDEHTKATLSDFRNCTVVLHDMLTKEGRESMSIEDINELISPLDYPAIYDGINRAFAASTPKKAQIPNGAAPVEQLPSIG